MITEKEARIEVESKVLGNAVQNGWEIQPDLKQLHKIYEGLAKNLINHGYMYCPCRIIVPGQDNGNKICPCKWAKTDIESSGRCKCRLYFGKKSKSSD